MMPPSQAQRYREAARLILIGDAQAGTDLLAALAHEGYAPAEDQVGRAHSDPVVALAWLYTSAAKGFPDAAVGLAEALLDGRGAPRDVRHAARWLAYAAERGDPDAMRRLGVLARDGRGRRQNHAEAVTWFLASALAGDAESQYQLGLCFLSGLGTRQDPRMACFWLLLAAAQDHTGAANLRDAVIASSALSAEAINRIQAVADRWRPRQN